MVLCMIVLDEYFDRVPLLLVKYYKDLCTFDKKMRI